MGTSDTATREFIPRFGHIKLTRIIPLIIIALVLVTFITHHYLIDVEKDASIIHSAHSHLDLPEESISYKSADLQSRIKELYRIKGSVSSELRDMEHKRQKLQQDIQLYTKNIEQLKAELLHQQTELNRLKISVEQAQVAQREALQQNTPELALPKRLTANSFPLSYPAVSKEESHTCRMYKCFDHSRCAMTSGFPVYLYDPDRYPVMNEGWDVDGFLKTTLKQVLGYNPHLTTNPKEACIFMVLVGEALRDSDDVKDDGENTQKHLNLPPLDHKALKKLPYWGGDGRNHVLLNLARRDLSATSGDLFSTVDTGIKMAAMFF